VLDGKAIDVFWYFSGFFGKNTNLLWEIIQCRYYELFLIWFHGSTRYGTFKLPVKKTFFFYWPCHCIAGRPDRFFDCNDVLTADQT
jgi:hypothetical protein